MQELLSSNMTDQKNKTLQQYHEVIARCKDLYTKKAKDYGTSWRVLRTISIVDQIYIKAWRIRQIQESGKQKIGDSIESEFIGIVNYGVIGLIQLALPADTLSELPLEMAVKWYNDESKKVEDLMLEKNHDYGEVWRTMSQESYVDMILTKLLRVKQILANDGQTIVSEGIDANYADIINYAVFALIRIEEMR